MSPAVLQRNFFLNCLSLCNWHKLRFNIMISSIYTGEETDLLSDCRLCPRSCRVNRFEGPDGYCRTDAGLNIASICIHRGEEPPISGKYGICNIFFAGCNLRCTFCQNHDISRSGSSMIFELTDMDSVLNLIEEILGKGIKAVGFVSPSHVVPQVKAIIRGLKARGLNPTTVYNTNSYDNPGVLRELADLIDVYLPDYKYFAGEIAADYSDAPAYPETAIAALKEMYYQKGSLLITDEDGLAEKGMLIRHLVLPGHADDSISVLKNLAEELSPGVSISLMSQYHPTFEVIKRPPLNRTLYSEEYNVVVEEIKRLGFRNVWLQDPGSHDNYLPDFKNEHPFE